MEKPLSLQTDESSPRLAKQKKYLGLSISAGAFYALPTLLVVTLISAILLFLVWAILESNFYQLTVFMNSYNFSLEMGILFGFSLLLAAIPAMIIGIASGRMVYRRSNQDDSGRRAGFSMATASGVGLIGLIIFPVLCYLIYIALLLVVEQLQLGDTWIGGLLTGGTESALAGILLICVPSVAIVLAYFAALISSWVVFRRRTSPSRPTDPNS